jgi:hypothetical protein
MISLATSTRFNTSTSRASKPKATGARRETTLQFALFVAILFVLVPAAQARVAVYKADYRLASDLLPYAEAGMGSEGKIQLDPTRNSILLVGDDAQVERTLSLLKAQDTAPRMIRLHYEHVRQEELSEYGLSIQWKGNYGHVILGEGKPVSREGLYVRWRDRQHSAEDRFQGELMILEGHSGRIATGRSVPLQNHSKQYGTQTSFIVGESGFEAQPTVLGSGKIQLELRPFQGEVQSNGQVEFSEASTSIVLSPGQSIVLGGIGQESIRADSAHGLSARERNSDQLLMITASIVEETVGEEGTP